MIVQVTNTVQLVNTLHIIVQKKTCNVINNFTFVLLIIHTTQKKIGDSVIEQSFTIIQC